MPHFMIEKGKEKQSILGILEYTYSYLEIERRIIEDNMGIIDVIILNQYQNIIFFLIYAEKVTVVSPYILIKDNVTIYTCGMSKELKNCGSNICYLSDIEKANRIIDAPKILLINYCNTDKFTIPRLNLSTHMLAAFLRVNTLVRVYVLDMQFDINDEDVIKEIILIRPNVVGLSLNYGFFEKSISFLDILYDIVKKSNLGIRIILGNIIPAIEYKNYLERYHDLVICYAEGELSIKDYIDYINKKKNIEEVSGIVYFDNTKGMIVKNQLNIVDMNVLPFPALDTLLDIKNRRGVLSLEFSRGCSHSACTFCPRNHKGRDWRYMSSEHMYELSAKLYDVCKKEGMSTRIYIADEEFVGYLNGYDENKRVIEYFSLLQQNKVDIMIDVSCRVDSIYNPKMGEKFNLEKVAMWNFCSKAGLGRVFLGVESFSNLQLIRYNKATDCNQNIIAIKILTSLGIDIRLGILLFDQLMASVSEIKENIEILGRKDIIQQKRTGNLTYEKIYFDIINGISNHANVPLYTKTSYLLTVMEVLKKSIYFRMCDSKGLVLSEDKNWGKYEVSFINKYVGILSDYLREWVNNNYPITYALKTLLKSAKDYEYQVLDQILEEYKTINYRLLQYSLMYVDDSGLVKNNVISFSTFISQNSIEGQDFLIVNINDFFFKALLDAKEIFRTKLNILKQKIGQNNIIGEKISQLIEQY